MQAWIPMVLAVLALQDAPIVTDDRHSSHPMDVFAFFIGTWENPDRPGTKVVMEWNLGRRAVEWTEYGAAGDEPFARGLIGYDAADDRIVFHDFFGASTGFFAQREMMFYGEFTVNDEGSLRRSFTAHYGDGWEGKPAAGSKIRFREGWERMGENGWRWTSEIERDGEWREYMPPSLMRRTR